MASVSKKIHQAIEKADEYAARQCPEPGYRRDSLAYSFLKGYVGYPHHDDEVRAK